jgi:hypothetical protein
MKLVLNPEEKLCSLCPGGATKMVQIPRTNTWVCSVCSGTDYYIPNQEPEPEQEYQIEYCHRR